MGMKTVPILTIRIYRSAPGDLGISDAQMPASPREAAIRTAMSRLKALFDDNERPGDQKPHWAELVNDDDVVVELIQMTPSGPHLANINAKRS